MGRKKGRGKGRGNPAWVSPRKKDKDAAEESVNEEIAEEEKDTEETLETGKENEIEESPSNNGIENDIVENNHTKEENIKAKPQKLNENGLSEISKLSEVQEKTNFKSSKDVQNKSNLEAKVQNENIAKDPAVKEKPLNGAMDDESDEDEEDGQLRLDLREDDVEEEEEIEEEEDDDEENELDVNIVSDEENHDMNLNSTQGAQQNTSSTASVPSAANPSEMVKNQLNQIQQQVMSHIMQYQANIMSQFQQLQSQMLSQAAGIGNTEMPATPPALDLSSIPPNLMNLTNLTQDNAMLNTMKSPGAVTDASSSNQTGHLQIRGGSRNAAKKSFNLNEFNEREAASAESSPSPDLVSSNDLAAAVNMLNRKRVAPKHFNAFDLDEIDGPTMNPPCFKRKRTAFNEKQYNVLETTFEHNNFPEPIDQHCIALRIKTPYRSIKMWFQNRRASVRKKLDPSERGAPGDDGVIKSASDPDARWYCNLCPSTFIAKKFLDRHRELHKTDTVSCGNCHMKFTHKLLLDTHRISKCSSKSGVDLSHINDEEDNMEYSKRVIEDYNRRVQSSLIGTPGAADLDQLMQSEESFSAADQNQQDEDSDDPADEQHLLQQLLVAQVKQAQEKQKQRQEDLVVKQYPKKKVYAPSHNSGTTIIPMPADSDKPTIKVKEEFKDPDYVIDDSQLQSTLQDQITSILEAEKRASVAEEDLKTDITIKNELDVPDCSASGVKESPVVTQQQKQSMHDQIQAILRQQELLMNRTTKPAEDEESELDVTKKRRRTTIFSEAQLRVLYLHFTYNNFPDPSMFKIIGNLAKLDDQVIKIWFQNERSRQRKRAKHIMEEANSRNKSYKCRECGMRFAMLTFLVKHSMRHISDGDDNNPIAVKICPICQDKFDKDQLVGHLRQTHNVNMSLLEEYRGGMKESLTCHLCKQKFQNQDGLMIHKHKHLTDDYGEPPSCSICKTTFVNAICLEAHFQTHDVEDWEFECNICHAVFFDKLLMASHRMGHGIRVGPSNLLAQPKTAAEEETKSPNKGSGGQVIKTLVTSVGKLGALSTSAPAIQVVKTLVSTSTTTPTTLTLPNSQVLNAGTTSLQIPGKTSSGVSFVKLIPVQIMPASGSMATSASGTGAKTIITTSSMKAPTHTTASNKGGITIATSSINSTSNAFKNAGLTLAGRGPGGQAFYKTTGGTITGSTPVISAVGGAGTTPTTTYLTLPVRGTNQIVKVAVRTGDGKNTNPLLNQLLDGNLVRTIGTKPGIASATGQTTFPRVQISTLQGANQSLRPTIKVTKQSVSKIMPNFVPRNKTAEDPEIVEIKKEVLSDGEVDPLYTQNDDPIPSGTIKVEDGDNASKTVASNMQLIKLVGNNRFIPILPNNNFISATTGNATVSTSSVNKSPGAFGSQKTLVNVLSEDEDVNPGLVASKLAILKARKSSRELARDPAWNSFDPSGYRRRRAPTYFSAKQREILEAHFNHDNFPAPSEQGAIANQLNVDYAVVKTWFQNNRKNYRKSIKEENNQNVESPFHCEVCNVSFIATKDLAEHKLRHNKPGEEGHTCSDCKVVFDHSSVYQTHLISHAYPHSGSDNPKIFDQKKHRWMALPTGDDGIPKGLSGFEMAKDQERDTDSELDEEDLLDVEKYRDDPLMSSVECILENETDNSTEGAVETVGDDTAGHRCGFCEISFASQIALKEHVKIACPHSGASEKQKQITTKVAAGRSGQLLKRKQGEVFPGTKKQKTDDGNLPALYNKNTYFEQLNSSPRRQRIDYTDEEQKVLHTHYDNNNFPLPAEMSLMARRLSIRYKQVIHWFQNKRSKDRKSADSTQISIQCPVCRATFVNNSNLEMHTEEYHKSGGSDKAKLSCSIQNCPAKFTHVELLSTHTFSHELMDVLGEFRNEGHEDDDEEDEEDDDMRDILQALGADPNSKDESPEKDQTNLLVKHVGILEAQYKENNFPDPMEVGFIARRVSVDPLYVHMWFKERRSQQINALKAGVEPLEAEKSPSSQRKLSKECRHCVSAFISQADLDTHELMHQSPHAKICSTCGAEFSSVFALETHWIRHGVFGKDSSKSSERLKQQEQEKEQQDVPHYATDEGRGPERGAKAFFTTSQLRVLDAHYMMNHFPGAVEIRLLAKRLGLRPRQVVHWFQNKRCKNRRMYKSKFPSSSTCSVCGAAFICESTLENHARLHQMDLQHKCRVCEAVFLSPILLETHMLHHVGILMKSKTLFDPSKQLDPTMMSCIVNLKAKLLRSRQNRGSDEETSESDLKIDDSYMDGVENMLEDEVEEAQLLDEIDEQSFSDTDQKAAIEVEDSEMDSNNTTDENKSEKSIFKKGANFTTYPSKSKLKPKPKGTVKIPVSMGSDDFPSDSEEDEPRLKIVSAYTISGEQCTVDD